MGRITPNSQHGNANWAADIKVWFVLIKDAKGRFGVATLGAILSNIARTSFLSAANAAGLSRDSSVAAAKHVISGDMAGALDRVPAPIKDQIHSVALRAFADGFASASLMAAAAAFITAFLAWRYIAADLNKGHSVPKADRPCMVVDCRHPI